MKRKNFISSILPASFAVGSIASSLKFEERDLKIPSFLKTGDLIGITSPAGFITLADLQPAIAKLEEWGYQVQVGNTIGKQDFTFGGTDEDRLADFQNMLDDKKISAILCARGGYGCIRIIDQLDFTTFKKFPKWVIGFSDVTVLHNHIFSNFRISTIHSKMCNSFPAIWNAATEVQKASIDSIFTALNGGKILYNSPINNFNKVGVGSGKLTGGNLRTLENLSGSHSSVDTKGCLLIVEDTGEYLYSIDRMFYNLKRSGKLKKLTGLIIGGFKIKPDDEGDIFGKTLEEIVLEKVKEYNYPVCFDFPVGHQVNNFALRLGVNYHLNVSDSGADLSSI